MDIIFIKGLVISSIIGIYSWERHCFQKLRFDLDIGYTRIGIYDGVNINNCYLDYQKIISFITILVVNNHFFLIESVAENVAMGLISKFGVSWVRIRVSKVGVIADGVEVGVMIERGIKDE